MKPADPLARELRPSIALTFVKSGAPILMGAGLALLVHMVLAPRMQPLHAKILQDIGINIILAVSLNIVNGFTGQFSIGHAGFMAVGGYTAAGVSYYASYALWGSPAANGGVLSFMGEWSSFEGPLFAGGDGLFLLACLAGGTVAAIAGVVVGLPSLRLRGDYLAIVTLGFGEIVRVLIQQSREQLLTKQAVEEVGCWERFLHLGGALGFTRLPFYTTHFWVWFFAFITLLVSFRLRQSSYGRAFLSIRENEIAAEAMGVPVTRYKVMAFVFAAFFAGIAGGLFAHQLGTTLNPGELGFQKSFDILIMVVLGGLGSISGAVVAAVALTILPEVLRDPPHAWPLALAIIIGILIFKRRAGIRGAVLLAALTGAFELMRAVAVWQEIDLSKYRMILYALSLILIMILRPQGLFGVREIWDWRPQWRKRHPLPTRGDPA